MDIWQPEERARIFGLDHNHFVKTTEPRKVIVVKGKLVNIVL